MKSGFNLTDFRMNFQKKNPMQDLQYKIQEIETVKLELEAKLYEARANLKRKDAIINRLAGEVTKLTAENSELSKQVSILKCNDRGSKPNSKDSKKELSNQETTDDHSAKVMMMKAENAKLLGEKAKLTCSIAKLKMNHAALISEHENKDQELEECKTKLKKNLESIKSYRTENLLLKHQVSSADIVEEETVGVKNLRLSVIKSILDGLEDMGNIELNDVQLNHVFKTIYEKKLKEYPEGLRSVHIPSKEMKQVIVQAKQNSSCNKSLTPTSVPQENLFNFEKQVIDQAKQSSSSGSKGITPTSVPQENLFNFKKR